MEQTVTLYHGTPVFKKIVEANAIQPKLFHKKGEKAWLERKREYIEKTHALAEYLRKKDDGQFLIRQFPDIVRNPNILNDDEYLVLELTHFSEISEQQREIHQISRALKVYLTRNWGEASTHAHPKDDTEIGATLELDIPERLLQPKVFSYRLAMGCIGLEYLTRVIVEPEDRAGITSLLEQHKISIPVTDYESYF